MKLFMVMILSWHRWEDSSTCKLKGTILKLPTILSVIPPPSLTLKVEGGELLTSLFRTVKVKSKISQGKSDETESKSYSDNIEAKRQAASEALKAEQKKREEKEQLSGEAALENVVITKLILYLSAS